MKELQSFSAQQSTMFHVFPGGDADGRVDYAKVLVWRKCMAHLSVIR
jgi:hypothetical protein